ncbi:MAG: phytoene desaturase [Caldithrix sp.]|nr:phytoene desaturase [Caldithrix sp.]
MGKRVIVVGGGLAGLGAAIRLAHAGFGVELFEKNLQLGGKMNHVKAQGYRFDTGPSLLTMPFIIDELFHAVSLKREDYLTFEPIDPICRYFWNDGSQLDASMHIRSMMDQLAGLSPQDAQRYADFLLYSKRIYEITADTFLYSAIHEPGQLLNRHNLFKLLQVGQIDPLHTVDQGVRRFFKDKRIVQLFNRYATYNGSDPFKAPATLNIIPFVEFVLGSYYIKGGMYQLVQQLHYLAEQSGVKIYTETSVDKILHKDGAVEGVLVNGTSEHSDVVLCNADIVVAHEQLIDGFKGHRKKLSRLEPSLSGMVFLWGLNDALPSLTHHNILFSDNYRKEFKALFDDLVIPNDPTIYLSITAKSGDDHAPAGKSNAFILLNMPYLNDSQDWDKAVDKMRMIILNRLKAMSIDVADKIEYEHVISPLDLYTKFSSNRGSIYGISSNNRTAAFKRPANRSRNIKNLYFAGGSVHPGGGIPLVLLSAKMAADLISKRH